MNLNLYAAILYSHDITKVIPFYRDTLGFAIEEQQGNRFVWFIFPNGGRLGVKTQTEERETPGHQTVFIGVEDIEEAYQQLKTKGVVFAKELIAMPWGHEFSVLDPDQNKVLYTNRKGR